MFDDESFDEFYAKLNNIVNSAYNLGEIYDQPKIVRKILRSLTEDFRPKVTTITESKNVDSIPVDELVGSLQSYELDLPKTNKSKSMALKPVDDIEIGGFDDELFAKVNNVKTKNMLLLDKVKSLELDLSVARSASSKLEQLLSVQK